MRKNDLEPMVIDYAQLMDLCVDFAFKTFVEKNPNVAFHITEKEINNKAIIENACKEEDIRMAINALQRQSEDKLIRQAYQRRKDEIYFYYKELADNIRRAEQAEKSAAQDRL